MSDERFPTYEQLFAGWERMQAERDRLRAALQIIADGTLCPDLFPTLDLEKDVWELRAKTAMTSAIAALERNAGETSAACTCRDGARYRFIRQGEDQLDTLEEEVLAAVWNDIGFKGCWRERMDKRIDDAMQQLDGR